MVEERRKHPRAACHIRVEYGHPGAPLVARAIATDISSGGLRAKAPLRPDFGRGDVVPMTLFLEDGPVKVSAKVVHSTSDAFAVAFHGLCSLDSERLAELVDRANAFRR